MAAVPPPAPAAPAPAAAAYDSGPRLPLGPASDSVNTFWVVPNEVREAVQVADAAGAVIPPHLRIILAAAQNHVAELARIVEEEGVEADVSVLGFTPMMVAVENRSQATMEWLAREAAVDVNGHGGWAFRTACGRGHVETMDRLLALGAEPSGEGQGGGRAGTSLMLAVLSGNPMAVRCILEDGRYRVDAQDAAHGFTALHWAAGGQVVTMDSARSRSIIIRLLLAAGADPTIKDRDGRPPAMYARQRIRGRTPDFVDVLEREAAEPERARLLHKLRLIHDAKHVITKARREARTRHDRKTKPVAAASAYLRERMARGEELPALILVGRDEELLGVVMHVVRRAGSAEGLPQELFAELMEMMLPIWAPERRRP